MGKINRPTKEEENRNESPTINEVVGSTIDNSNKLKLMNITQMARNRKKSPFGNLLYNQRKAQPKQKQAGKKKLQYKSMDMDYLQLTNGSSANNSFQNQNSLQQVLGGGHPGRNQSQVNDQLNKSIALMRSPNEQKEP